LAGGALFSALGFKPRRTVAASARFEHGVASGDPLSDRVILWTRVSGVGPDRAAVEWRVALDTQFENVVAKGDTWAVADSDFTVKVDAKGLPAGQTLYFDFVCDGVSSPAGRTKTLAKGEIDRARFAVVSCSNFPYGYFHVYRAIAGQDNLDAVVHLGDYIYEYGLGEYATEHAQRLDRVPEPAGSIVTLDEYRKRHAQYKADPDSQAMHGRHPLIAVWDDHELANDAWKGGAQNHSEAQGDWGARRDAAIQAWLEWMPVRVRHDRERTRTFREFHFGDLAALIMLDTRLFGRARQPDAGDGVTPESIEAAMRDPQRRLLGPEQESWFKDALDRGSKATWQLIGQQVMVSPTRTPDLEPLLDLDARMDRENEAYASPEALRQFIEISKSNPPMLLDTWNGYPVARATFLTDLAQHAKNPVVLSGDLHTSLAGNLVPHGGSEPVAVEFMTTSVTSPGFAEYLPEVRPGALAAATIELNPTLTYMETTRRGWLDVELTHDHCIASWHLVDTVHARDHRFETDQRFRVRAGAMTEGMTQA
jgi:alkaline phosphatase D